jgi:hypothetical protein
MRRCFLVIFILLLLVSCGSPAAPSIRPTITPGFPSETSTPLPPSPAPTLLPSRTPTPAPATPTPSTSPTSTAPPSFSVYYHPDDVLYVGDQVSIEVVSPPELNMDNATLQVRADPPNGPDLGTVKFGPWGIQGRYEAALIWAWDTWEASPGQHTLAFEVQPQAYSWTDQVSLLPYSDMPPKQAEAKWAETQTQCCTVFYITETASQRDLANLSSIIDAQAQDALAKMEASITVPITITLLPRVLGNGGFTSSEISVSYLDRDYASVDWAMVVHHEMIHAIDAKLGGDFRPSIFVEGLAVYMTGGHYHPEPLMSRASALLDGYLGWYIPLKTLADDFYASQHEVGYLEGASLVEYMVETYGLDNFFTFYRDIHNQSGESQSDSIDAALQAHFSISFVQLEQDFIVALKAEPDTTAWVDNVRLEVNYYETMRRYQQQLDPSAYFRTAWLMDNRDMRQRGIVADYLRHPHTPTNLALETLLITAGQQMVAADYAGSAQILQQINSVLDGTQQESPEPFSVSAITAAYFAISSTLQQQGDEVQNINLSGDSALTQVTTLTSPKLIQLNLQRMDGQWSINP